jgi:hypothetical protein
VTAVCGTLVAVRQWKNGTCTAYWPEYFNLASSRTLWSLDRFVLARIARWSRHKHNHRLPEWSLTRGGRLYREHGLTKWWRPKQPARAPA